MSEVGIRDVQKLLMLKASSGSKHLWLGKLSEVPRLAQNLLSELYSEKWPRPFDAEFLEYSTFTYLLRNQPFPWKPKHCSCLVFSTMMIVLTMHLFMSKRFSLIRSFCTSTMRGIRLYIRSISSNNRSSALVILQEVRLASSFDLLS